LGNIIGCIFRIALSIAFYKEFFNVSIGELVPFDQFVAKFPDNAAKIIPFDWIASINIYECLTALLSLLLLKDLITLKWQVAKANNVQYSEHISIFSKVREIFSRFRIFNQVHLNGFKVFIAILVMSVSGYILYYYNTHSSFNVLGDVGAFFQGVVTKSPESDAIAASNVKISGSFDGYLKSTGDGITIKTTDAGDIKILLDIAGIKKLQPVIDSKVAEYKKSRGWGKDSCAASVTEAKLFFDNFEIKFRDNDARNNFVSSLLKIDPKAKDSIDLASFMGSTGRKKVAAKKLAAKDDTVVSLVLKYKIKNETIAEKLLSTVDAYEGIIVIE
jgi:hypothetical protein